MTDDKARRTLRSITFTIPAALVDRTRNPFRPRVDPIEFVERCHRLVNGAASIPWRWDDITWSGHILDLADELVLDYYAEPNNGAGGSLHVVLDDGNVRDSDVDFCERWALEHEDPMGVALAQVIRAIPFAMRVELSCIDDYLVADILAQGNS